MFVLALILLFFLVRPMITILLSSTILSYIAFPLYTKINKKIPYKSLSIILSLFIIVIIVLIPFAFLAFEVTQQGSALYSSLSNNIAKGQLFGIGCTSANSTLCSVINHIEKFSLDRLSAFGFNTQLQKLLPILEEKIATFILTIPIIIAEIILALVMSFFILKDWENILKKIENILPMRKKTTKRLITEFGDITHTVVYAQLFVAFVQGVLGTIGFYIFGVPLPIILGLVMAFAALIPTIGTAILWVPISLFMVISGYLSHDYGLMYRGIGLFFYCLVIIGTIDSILLAKIVHSKTKTKVSQIVVIIGVIGGATMFGVPGIFIGPILLPLLLTYFETFKQRHDKIEKFHKPEKPKITVPIISKVFTSLKQRMIKEK